MPFHSLFSHHIDTTDHPHQCWIWQGATDRAGYGHFYFQGKRHYAHRASYEIHYGAIPSGLYVCHHCDNPPCVNPSHLFVGTARDNNRDRAQKGRTYRESRPLSGVYGERHPKSRLTDAQRRDIWQLFASGESPSRLSRLFGVSRRTIRRTALDPRWSPKGGYA